MRTEGNSFERNTNPVSHISKSLGIAAMAFTMTISCGSKMPGADSSSFLLSTGSPLTTETTIISTRPLDNGETFRLGYGYDKLSGERRLSCLDPEKYSLVGRNVRTTESKFTIVQNKEDLARQLDIEVNAEASLNYAGKGSGSIETKNKILKSASFSDRSIVGLLTFTHMAQEIDVESRWEILDDESVAYLDASPELFRLFCGDAYTKSVTTGAALYILVELESSSSAFIDKTETANKLSASIGNAFTGSLGANVNASLDESFSKFTISADCVSFGVTADVCAQSITALDAEDLSPVSQYINSAKSAMASSINSNPNLMVAVSESFEYYPKPLDRISERKDDIFFSYSDNLAIVRDLLTQESQAYESCLENQLGTCIPIQNAFAEQIENCSRQEYWADCEPDTIDISQLLVESQDYGIGIVRLYENHYAGVTGGVSFTIDFDKPAGSPVRFEPNRIYNLADWNFNDYATGVESHLRPGWQLRIFEHENGGGRCYMVKGNSNRVHNFAWFNDKASSFRLERMGDYPQSCN